MATCRDCFSFGDCLNYESTPYYGLYAACNNVQELCKNFKNKADFVEVKHGEWLNNGTICSNCKQINPTLRLDMENEYVGAWLEYCPNCGAKMHSQL